MSANCNLYANNPLLADVKTKYDENLSNMACQWVEKQDTGPNPVPGQRPAKQNGMCPFKSLGTAYDFSAGPTPVNRKPIYNL